MKEEKKTTRTLHFSVHGGFINDLALEKCHNDYDICYAVDLLMDSLQTDLLSEAERLMLALRVLNGEVEIHGTYPGDDYGPVELEVRNKKYDLQATLVGMKGKICEQKEEIDRLRSMLACCAEAIGDDRKLREINREWNNGWGEKGTIFEGVEEAYTPLTGMNTPVGEFLERMGSESPDEDYGWLEPNGTFHAVSFGGHQAWAFAKAKQLGLLEENINDGRCGDILLKHGWVLLDNPMMGLARATASDTRPLTKSQREFLFDYYTERGRHSLAKSYLEEE